MIDIWPTSVFVDRNNTVYMNDLVTLNVKEWRAGSTTFTRTIFNNLKNPKSLFVTTDGTIYVDNGDNGTVEKWTLNGTESTLVMNVTSSCHGLFVDINNNLYCSLRAGHLVVKQWLDADRNMSETIIAGNGSCGSELNMLCEPCGIFVTIKLDLYVADCGNDRIQLFQLEHLTEKTVVGDVVFSSIKLNCPTGVVVDADDYLFIVDSMNSRIIRSNLIEFYCVIGCSTFVVPFSDKLVAPFTAAFDNVGNIFVVGTYNHLVQEFILMTNNVGM